MNTIDKLLSDTADYFEDRLRSDPALCQELIALRQRGQCPCVTRPLDNEVSGAAVTIGVGQAPA
jgi:hypothetical protein